MQNPSFSFFLPFYQRLYNALSALRQAQRTTEQFSIIGTEEGHSLFENFGNLQNFKKGMSFFKTTSLLFCQSAGTEKRSRIRLRTTEGKVEGHRLLAATLLKESLTELHRNLRIVYSLLLEVLESVLVQNL